MPGKARPCPKWGQSRHSDGAPAHFRPAPVNGNRQNAFRGQLAQAPERAREREPGQSLPAP